MPRSDRLQPADPGRATFTRSPQGRTGGTAASSRILVITRLSTVEARHNGIVESPRVPATGRPLRPGQARRCRLAHLREARRHPLFLGRRPEPRDADRGGPLGLDHRPEDGQDEGQDQAGRHGPVEPLRQSDPRPGLVPESLAVLPAGRRVVGRPRELPALPVDLRRRHARSAVPADSVRRLLCAAAYFSVCVRRD